MSLRPRNVVWNDAVKACAEMLRDPGRMSKFRTPAEALESLSVPLVRETHRLRGLEAWTMAGVRPGDLYAGMVVTKIEHRDGGCDVEFEG